jgi:hypothetical protein
MSGAPFTCGATNGATRQSTDTAATQDSIFFGNNVGLELLGN